MRYLLTTIWLFCGTFITATFSQDMSDACRLYNWSNGIHPHPYDCTKFIECTFLKTNIMPCPPDQGYHEVMQTCIPVEFVPSCYGSGVSDTPGGNTPRPTSDTSCVKGKLDILFIIDSSSDIDSATYTNELSYAVNLAENFQIGPSAVQFAAITFGSSPHVVFSFGSYTEYKPLQAAILNATFQGGITNTHLALEGGLDLYKGNFGARPGSPRVAVVFTNGKSSDPVRTKQQVALLKQAGVYVIAVALGNPNLQELQDIASEPSAAFTGNFINILKAIQAYSDKTCNEDFTCTGVQLADIIFVLDSSNSITDEEYNIQLQFVVNVTEKFTLGPADVRFGGVIFSTDTVKLFDLKDYNTHDSLRSAILLKTIHLKSGTDTAKALNFVYDQNMYGTSAGGRNNATKILIIMTDGRSNSMDDTVKAARRLKGIEVKFIAIGIGNDIFLEELSQLASDNQSLFTVAGFSALNQIQESVTKRTCELHQITTTVPPKPTTEYVCYGYQLADVIFVLDSSNSITTPDYNTQLQFVVDVTSKFTVGPADVRFGGVIFSTDTVKLFDLKNYNTHDTLKSAILSATHLKSGTDTAKALNFVYDQDMFGTSAGGRYNATKILIIMTDGRSNSMDDTVRAAQRLKGIQVKFIAIGIGSDIFLDELIQLASDNQSLFTVAGFSALDQIQESVTRRTCEYQQVTTSGPSPSNLCFSYRWTDGIHPNPFDCSTYVRCQSFVTSIIHCMVGEAYDPISQRCTDKSVAHRCDDPAYFDIIVSSGPGFNPSTTRRPNGIVITSVCRDYHLDDGIYPDPGDCAYFVDCTAYRTDYLACPQGLHYNTLNQVCDDVHDVNCDLNYNYFNYLG